MAPRLDLSPEHNSLPPPGPCCRQGGEEEKAAPQNRAAALLNAVKLLFGCSAGTRALLGWSVPVAPWFDHPRMQLLLPKTRRSHVPGLFGITWGPFFASRPCRRPKAGKSKLWRSHGNWRGWIDGWRQIPAHACATSSLLLPTQPACVTLRLLPITERGRKTPG